MLSLLLLLAFAALLVVKAEVKLEGEKNDSGVDGGVHHLRRDLRGNLCTAGSYGSGLCQDVSSCQVGSTPYRGYCPNTPSNIQCCVPNKIQTSRTCTAGSAGSGLCQDVSSCQVGSTPYRGYCPNTPSNIQCCVPNKVQTSRTCTAGTAGSGLCQDVSSCQGGSTPYRGYCPNTPSNIQCCVPNKIKTPPPSPLPNKIKTPPPSPLPFVTDQLGKPVSVNSFSDDKKRAIIVAGLAYACYDESTIAVTPSSEQCGAAVGNMLGKMYQGCKDREDCKSLLKPLMNGKLSAFVDYTLIEVGGVLFIAFRGTRPGFRDTIENGMGTSRAKTFHQENKQRKYPGKVIISGHSMGGINAGYLFKYLNDDFKDPKSKDFKPAVTFEAVLVNPAGRKPTGNLKPLYTINEPPEHIDITVVRVPGDEYLEGTCAGAGGSRGYACLGGAKYATPKSSDYLVDPAAKCRIIRSYLVYKSFPNPLHDIYPIINAILDFSDKCPYSPSKAGALP